MDGLLTFASCQMLKSLMCSFVICIYSVMKSLLISFAHFLIGLFALFTVEFQEFFISYRYSSFVRRVVCIHFLPLYSLSFHLLNKVFHRPIVFFFLILMKFSISDIFFYVLCFWYFLRAVCLTLAPQNFLLFSKAL